MNSLDESLKLIDFLLGDSQSHSLMKAMNDVLKGIHAGTSTEDAVRHLTSLVEGGHMNDRNDYATLVFARNFSGVLNKLIPRLPLKSGSVPVVSAPATSSDLSCPSGETTTKDESSRDHSFTSPTLNDIISAVKVEDGPLTLTSTMASSPSMPSPSQYLAAIASTSYDQSHHSDAFDVAAQRDTVSSFDLLGQSSSPSLDAAGPCRSFDFTIQRGPSLDISTRSIPFSLSSTAAEPSPAKRSELRTIVGPDGLIITQRKKKKTKQGEIGMSTVEGGRRMTCPMPDCSISYPYTKHAFDALRKHVNRECQGRYSLVFKCTQCGQEKRGAFAAVRHALEQCVDGELVAELRDRERMNLQPFDITSVLSQHIDQYSEDMQTIDIDET